MFMIERLITRQWVFGEGRIIEKLNRDGDWEYWFNNEFVFAVGPTHRFKVEGIVNLYDSGYFDYLT